ncbi:leucine-rich repeat receptor-like protein kinase TDR [Miscanthus floridulus]|uniref:leucine-rich repeat receptor-like protein kinase TDR n=1 Tax=Miscanthus floridulus TaxID=154761 RepID=UPI003459E51D
MLAEVEVLGHLQHSNIGRLLGWCTDGEATLLLYEYMLNDSLDNLLHYDCVPAVAHHDLKPSNILLDTNMEAHVANYMSSLTVHRGGR